MKLCGFDIGIDKPFFLIAGPCVVENESVCLRVAAALKKTCQRLGITYIFKASYDKANRTSAKSFRGPGIEAGLEVLFAGFPGGLAQCGCKCMVAEREARNAIRDPKRLGAEAEL